MKAVWTYVITVDGGAAPNFDPPATTLTVCKPGIRRAAKIGDLILAFNGKTLNPTEPHSVRWAGIVSEVISMKDYWDDCRFEGKKPGVSSSPDNFYRPNETTGVLEQVENKTHTPDDYGRDVRGLNALVLQITWHFGPSLILPEHFSFLRMIGGRRGQRRFQMDDPTWQLLRQWLDQSVPNFRPRGTFVESSKQCASLLHFR